MNINCRIKSNFGWSFDLDKPYIRDLPKQFDYGLIICHIFILKTRISQNALLKCFKNWTNFQILILTYKNVYTIIIWCFYFGLHSIKWICNIVNYKVVARNGNQSSSPILDSTTIPLFIKDRSACECVGT